MARCVNCMSQGKYVFLFCLFLCLSGLVFLLSTDDRTRDLLQRTVQSQEFGRYSKHALVPLSGILSGRRNLTEFGAGQSNESASHPSDRLAEANISVGPELTIDELTKEEKKYRHDDQYEQYLRCPTTVRKKMLSDPIISQKLVLDIPILMWDEHFNASEYTRLTQFRGISGWRGTSNQDVHKLLKLLKSPNNRYMFDDRLVKGEAPPGDCIRCAVIGNGGVLNGSRKGAEIDAHDYVFRVNTALTKGFESDVGAKTSFYCFTMVTLSNTLAGRRGTGFDIPKGDEKMRYLFFADNEWTYNYLAAAMLKQTIPKSTGRYHRSPPTFPRQLTPDNVKIVHPDFERYLKWSWVNSSAQHKDIHRPTTGAIMLLTALHTCDQVSIYGFAGSYDSFSEHYYDKTFKKHVFYANHDNRAENRLWELLHERGIVTLFKRTDKQ